METHRLGHSFPAIHHFVRLEVIVAGSAAGIIGVSAVGMIVSAVPARVMRMIIC